MYEGRKEFLIRSVVASDSPMTRRRISSRLSPTDPINQRRLTFARRVHAERRIRSTLLMSNRARPSVCLALPHLVGEPIYAVISEQPCEIYRRLQSTKCPARLLFYNRSVRDIRKSS